MKPSIWIYIFNLSTIVAAASIVYFTDIPGYAPLAACARTGLSYAIGGVNNQCPTGVTPLQSCVCTKGNNLNAIRNTVTSSVQVWCSLAGSDDVNSAVSVYNDYCNQNGTPPPPPQLTTTTKAGGVGGLAAPSFTAASPGFTASVSEPDTETNTPKQTGFETSSSSSNTTSTSTPTPMPTATNGVPIAAVAGGAMAFIALMVSGLVAFFCYRRNNKRKMERMQEIQQVTAVGPIIPPKHDTHHTHNEITHNHSFTNNIHNTTTNNTPILEHPPNMNMYPQPVNHSLPQPFNHQQQRPPPFSSSPAPTTLYRPGISYTNRPNRLIEPGRNDSSHPGLQNQLPQDRPQQQTPQSHSPPMKRHPVAHPSSKSRNDYEVEEM